MRSRTHTGPRIRERRVYLGIRQAELARRVGISPSYLNLIEHNRRGIGGKLLLDLARELEVEISALTEAAEEALLGALRDAAERDQEAQAELARIDEMAGRFPGWSRVVAGQQRRISALEETVDTLSDRLTHDLFLSESMHDILTTVTAIRSTASILAKTPDIEASWLERFHGNVFRDSRKLSEATQALVSYFDQMSRQETGFSTAPDAAANFAEAHDYHFEEMERGADPQAIVDAAPALGSEAEKLLARRYLDRYGEDARQLPLDTFLPMAEQLAFDPGRIAAAAGVDMITVFRRLAALPQDPGRPGFGLVICDGSGTLTFRKPLPGFTLPRYGAACPLWPLYQALIRPASPVRKIVEMPDRARFLAHAICLPAGGTSFDAPQIVEAAMLLQRLDDDRTEGLNAPLHEVGTSCRICPRGDCPARREPSLLQEGF